MRAHIGLRPRPGSRTRWTAEGGGTRKSRIQHPFRLAENEGDPPSNHPWKGLTLARSHRHPSTRAGLWLAWAIALLAAAPAAAGVIRGSVHVPGGGTVTAAIDAYPGRACALPGAHMAPRGVVTDAVVYVEQAPASVPGEDDPPPTLAQKDQMFVPRVLAIAAGTSVGFPNLDPIFHNVFSLSPVRRFDLGRYPRGHSKQVVFTRPGLVNVYCDIHSSMAAFILVLPHHVFTRPDAQGAFALPELPAGHYVLHVWHPDLGDRRRDVDVPARGGVDADVSF